MKNFVWGVILVGCGGIESLGTSDSTSGSSSETASSSGNTTASTSGSGGSGGAANSSSSGNSSNSAGGGGGGSCVPSKQCASDFHGGVQCGITDDGCGNILDCGTQICDKQGTDVYVCGGAPPVLPITDRCEPGVGDPNLCGNLCMKTFSCEFAKEICPNDHPYNWACSAKVYDPPQNDCILGLTNSGGLPSYGWCCTT